VSKTNNDKKFSPSFDLLPSSYSSFFPSFLVPMEKNPKTFKKIKMPFLFHGALPFAMRKPLLSLLLQNPLDHESGQCGPENRPFRDLKLHGFIYILFFLV
jgi:hypothetical protein